MITHYRKCVYTTMMSLLAVFPLVYWESVSHITTGTSNNTAKTLLLYWNVLTSLMVNLAP